MYVAVETPAATPRFLQTYHENGAQIRAEVSRGLAAQQAVVEPKFLYDPLGSSLFTAITQLPEYYPTRTESQILHRNQERIARRCGDVQVLIDLGAGDCAKAAALFPVLQPRQYVPVDISIEFLRGAAGRLAAAYPGLDIVALGQDFSQELQLPQEVAPDHRLFFYPGSSIGNCAPAQALGMLRRIHERAAEGDGGGILIGVDCVKPAEVLVPAYDDALQVTAAFNRNLLLHLNRVLDTDFRIEDWRHLARYDRVLNRVEMHLEALAPVTVSWPDGERAFLAGETIHTESSYKYRPDEFAGMLAEAGFDAIERWTDPAGWFAVFHARA